MQNDLQISFLKRKIGSLMIQVGVHQLRNAQSDFISTKDGISKILNAVKPLGIQTTGMDLSYRFTSWDNWLKIIDVLNPIAEGFKWETDVFDCDNRAELMSALCALIFRINTCARVYCEVSDATTGVAKYLHWCNLIVDGDSNVFLWDVDNHRLAQKIIANNCVMGGLKYKFISLRAG